VLPKAFINGINLLGRKNSLNHAIKFPIYLGALILVNLSRLKHELKAKPPELTKKQKAMLKCPFDFSKLFGNPIRHCR